MNKTLDLIVVIPVGPKCNLDFVSDTIESLCFYITASFEIIIIDDSGVDDSAILKKKFPHLKVLQTPKPAGRYGGLFLTLCQAFKYAIDNYQFTCLWKVDTDELIIGKEPEKEPLSLFKTNPAVGMAGQYNRQYNGNPWDTKWPRARIINGTTTWKFIKRPVSNWTLRKLYKRALQHGYIAGESVFCSYFISEKCLLEIDKNGWLELSSMRGANLEDDHIFPILVKGTGFSFFDLSVGDKPFALDWNQLPDSPENLLKNKKKIIHSVRKWENMDEAQIRDYFKQQRDQKTATE